VSVSTHPALIVQPQASRTAANVRTNPGFDSGDSEVYGLFPDGGGGLAWPVFKGFPLVPVEAEGEEAARDRHELFIVHLQKHPHEILKTQSFLPSKKADSRYLMEEVEG
jgi:hypothetical protein